MMVFNFYKTLPFLSCLFCVFFVLGIERHKSRVKLYISLIFYRARLRNFN